MSCFLEILKCLICWEENEGRRYNNGNYSTRNHGDYGTSVRSYTPSPDFLQLLAEESRIRIETEQRNNRNSTPMKSTLHEPSINSPPPPTTPKPSFQYYNWLDSGINRKNSGQSLASNEQRQTYRNSTPINSILHEPLINSPAPAPKPSFLYSNSLDSGIDRTSSGQSLASNERKTVKASLEKPHEVSQMPKSSAPLPPQSFQYKNSLDSGIERKSSVQNLVSNERKTVKPSLVKPHEVSQTPKSSAPLTPPPSVQKKNALVQKEAMPIYWISEDMMRLINNAIITDVSPPASSCSDPPTTPKKKKSIKADILRENVKKPSTPSVHKSNSAYQEINKLNDGIQYHIPSRGQSYKKSEVKEPGIPKSKWVPRRHLIDIVRRPSSSGFDTPTTPKKTEYVVVQKDTIPIFEIPDAIKSLIENDIVPGVLRQPLTLKTYRDYFAALLYAEDFYFEKWNGYCLSDVTLELHEAAIYEKSTRNKNLTESGGEDKKIFVAFEIDSIPEKRPFLLSRDFVFVRPSEEEVEPFKGILYRVVNRNIVLAEFEDDFHNQHVPNCKYDVSFSFNRVCLKRCHQAIAAATDPLFQIFLFPEQTFEANIPFYLNTDRDKKLAIEHILRLRGPPPYLINGQLDELVVREAILQIYRTSRVCRILITAPTNKKCDMMMRSFKEIPESDMFRANAAFREYDEVPEDILTLPSCRYERGCFTCHSLEELKNFKVISSTFMSCFRLHNEGICAGHFSHIFMVETSSATEPEAMVALANLTNDKTAVIVAGALGNRSRWVRSDIGRRNGLSISYFERLSKSKPYSCFDDEY